MSEVGLVGSVEALWRYPVKSMMGERVETVGVTERGILGDRAYAFVDQSTGKLGSVKNPRKWGFLLTCKARFAEPVESDQTVPPALITLPDGACLPTNRPETAKILSELLGRKVLGLLLTCKARFAEPVESDETVPPALITLPDGACLPTNRPETAKILSELLGLKVYSQRRRRAALPREILADV